MRFLRATAVVHEDIKIQVPSMGDSISEGSVAEIEKQPGAWSAANLSPEHVSGPSMDLIISCLHDMQQRM